MARAKQADRDAQKKKELMRQLDELNRKIKQQDKQSGKPTERRGNTADRPKRDERPSTLKDKRDAKMQDKHTDQLKRRAN